MFRDRVEDAAFDDGWSDVGVHPTPDTLALTFGAVVSAWVRESASAKKRSLRVLDACSGDGRLGHSVAAHLVRMGYSVQVTFVEVDRAACNLIEMSATYGIQVVCSNLFSFEDKRGFDLVVSNPPYQAISRSDALKFGFSWAEVEAAGRNLYGLSIKKCIELTKRVGCVALIAPHGWLKNGFSGGLRQFVTDRVTHVEVDAFSRRTLFPGVNQDTAFQRLTVNKSFLNQSGTMAKSPVNVKLGFDQGAVRYFHISGDEGPGPATVSPFRVRIGPLVWNRQKAWLQRKSNRTVVVVNGPNVGKDGQLNLGDARTRHRRYINAVKAPADYVTRAPFIVLKRTMRGSPGRWIVDVAYVRERGFSCVAENHTIVIEVVDTAYAGRLPELHMHLAERVRLLHEFHGHPNLSVALVRRAVEELIAQPD